MSLTLLQNVFGLRPTRFIASVAVISPARQPEKKKRIFEP